MFVRVQRRISALSRSGRACLDAAEHPTDHPDIAQKLLASQMYHISCTERIALVQKLARDKWQQSVEGIPTIRDCCIDKERGGH